MPNIARRAKQLKHSHYGHIKIPLDHTSRQLEPYKALKNELNKYRSKGEVNLVIQ